MGEQAESGSAGLRNGWRRLEVDGGRTQDPDLVESMVFVCELHGRVTGERLLGVVASDRAEIRQPGVRHCRGRSAAAQVSTGDHGGADDIDLDRLRPH
ncbi:hypothetical protein [Streptomyces sp. A30]|uniref:hypothetical protein n=1 Tax=Streptomyces sp. A30 TaxID=2789273 RepID=UPI00397EF6E4